jgi:hypothetical protein
MTAETQTRQPQMGLTFEDVWAAMMETDRKFQETDRKFQETDRKFQESKAEHDRMIAETDKKFRETDAQIKETAAQIKSLGKQMGGLHRSFGDLTEQLVAPNLVAKFRELQYTFTKAAYDVEFKEPNGNTMTEVDVWLENGDSVMAVEIKSKLLQKDVDEHLERMEILKGYGKGHTDTRKLLGAVAVGIMRKDARDYAIKNGFYVIEQSGDTLKIEMPEGFKPKTW